MTRTATSRKPALRPPQPVFEPGDLVRAKNPRNHPLAYCVSRTTHLGIRGYYVRPSGQLSSEESLITWPVRKIGRWDGPPPPPSPSPLPPLPGRPDDGLIALTVPPRLPADEFEIGCFVETARGRRSKRDLQPALYLITRLGEPVAFGGRALYGRRVFRQTGEVVGPEIRITWRVRRVTREDAK